MVKDDRPTLRVNLMAKAMVDHGLVEESDGACYSRLLPLGFRGGEIERLLSDARRVARNMNRGDPIGVIQGRHD